MVGLKKIFWDGKLGGKVGEERTAEETGKHKTKKEKEKDVMETVTQSSSAVGENRKNGTGMKRTIETQVPTGGGMRTRGNVITGETNNRRGGMGGHRVKLREKEEKDGGHG